MTGSIQFYNTYPPPTHYLFNGRGTRYPNINTPLVRVTYCLIITGYSSQHHVRGGGGGEGNDEGTVGAREAHQG